MRVRIIEQLDLPHGGTLDQDGCLAVDFDDLRDAVRHAHLSSPPDKSDVTARIEFGGDAPDRVARLVISWAEDV